MLWCFEDNRKRGLSNILATSPWCEEAWDGNSFAPLIRRWLSCANQSDGPTETKVGLQAPPNRILHSSFLAVPHMTWWVNFVSKSCRFLKHRLQYNPRTMWPPSETDTSRPKQGTLQSGHPALPYSSCGRGTHLTPLCAVLLSAVLGRCSVHSSKKKTLI